MMMFLWRDDWRNIRTSGRSARCASCLSFTRTGTVYRTATTEMRPFERQSAFMPRRADFLVELRGFEPMGIAGAGRSRANPLLASIARSLPAARAFSIAIDTLASVALFWLRSPASQRSPRHKVDRGRRGGRRNQHRKDLLVNVALLTARQP
jgi:hypothetical protein